MDPRANGSALAGYELDEVAFSGPTTLVLRGRRGADGRPVYVKRHRTPHPSTQDIARLRRDFELGRRVGPEASVEYLELIADGAGVAVVTADDGLEPLDARLAASRLELRDAVRVARLLAQALAVVHEQAVVHGDVKPANVVVDAATTRVRFIDFGIAAPLSREGERVASGDSHAATLAYCAPEQTGRMNRAVDTRADLYAMGVTFFELFTGALPFRELDALALVHAHLARVAPRADALAPELPAPLADLVARLLRKDPDERYQTAHGVAADLERIETALAEHRTVAPFRLATDDVDARLVLPQKLYGRDAALAHLFGGLERAEAGEAVAMSISGFPGIGKSALVDELERPTAIRGGYFVRGRFEQFRRDVPYAAIAQAIHGLLQAVGALPTERRVVVEARVREALAEDGRALLELSPELSRWVDETDELADVGPEARRSRLFRAVSTLFRNIVGDEGVLLLFIDDLQWADEASLALFAAVLVELPRTLLLFAYRDSDVSTADPMVVTLRALEEKRKRPFERIALAPLVLSDVAAWLADALRTSTEEVAELARVVHERTAGNPFFVRQLVMVLRARGVVRFDLRDRRFTWDLSALGRIELGEDVLTLLRGRLAGLPGSTLALLGSASILGAEGDLALLARVADRTPDETRSVLDAALDEGLIRLLDQGRRYRFVHDRVQQAVYEGLDDRTRVALHHAAGHALLESQDAEHGDRNVEIALHLAEARSLARSAEERRALASVLLRGAERALISSAFEQALRLSDIARAAAYADGTPEPGSSLQLALVRANAMLALARHDELATLVRELEAEGHSLDELAPVHVAYLRDLGHLRSPREALDRAGEVLVRYGIRIPDEPGPRHLLPSLARLYARLGRAPRTIEELPEHAEPRALVETQLILAIHDQGWSLSSMHGVFFLLQIALRARSLGRTAYAGVAVGYFGLAVATVFGDVQKARALCELGISLVRERGRFDLLPAATIGHLVLVLPWCEPLAATLEPLRESFGHAVDTGDSHNVAQFAEVILFHRIFLGHEVSAVAAEAESFRPALERDRGTALALEYMLQYLDCLRGNAPDPSTLRGPRFDAAVEIPRELDEPTRFGMALHDLMLAVFLGTGARAAESFAVAAEHAGGARDIFMRALWPYYGGLALLAAAPEAGAARRRTLRRVRGFLSELEKLEKLQPDNLSHRTALVRAELARVEGRIEVALTGYRDATATARRNGWPHELALAHEKAARFHLARGEEVAGRGHLEDAFYGYERWGASAKVSALALEFPRLLGHSEGRRLTTGVGATPTITTGGLGLDVVSVSRAAQVLSGVIDRDSVVARLLELAAENAGARRGALVVVRDGEPHVEAGFEADDAGGRTLSRIGERLDRTRWPVPISLVRDVLASGKPVVLDDAASLDAAASASGVATTDAPRGSALAMPLTRSGEVVGALVLTNELLTAAFTPARVTVLEVLASKAAISLENARLYAELGHALERQVALTEANRRFVPQEFIASLGHHAIDAVALGDSVQKTMTVLFSDVRAFTSLVEGMTPEANIGFINEYLAAMEPAILEAGGFVDSYIGDAIMALFDGPPERGLEAGIGMLRRLELYNDLRRSRGERPLRIGVGVNTGELTLGTIGGPQRIKCGVIGDPVNLGSRIETATKRYGVAMLVGDETIARLEGGAHTTRFDLREVDRVRVRGRKGATTLYEVFDADPDALRSKKRAHAATWSAAIEACRAGRFTDARDGFARYLQALPDDPVARLRLERCEARMRDGTADQDDVVDLVEK